MLAGKCAKISTANANFLKTKLLNFDPAALLAIYVVLLSG
jgi:hypothetical protein